MVRPVEPARHDPHRRPLYAAINYIYNSLEEDREEANISHIIQALHGVVADAIVPRTPTGPSEAKIYDISAIDFDRLRQEFERSKAKNTQTRALLDAIEKRLAAMLAKNPLRTNFQKHYEELVAQYNAEKDRVTIEQTWEKILRFVASLSEEDQRAVRENLSEEALAIFDLLKKPDLTPGDIKKIKKVAVDLYAQLERIEQQIQGWRRKESTRDQVRTIIYDALYREDAGLPDSYSDDEIGSLSDAVYAYAFTQPDRAVFH